MTTENGSPGGYYQALDRKIDAVERDFRVEIGAIRAEMREGNAAILDKIDRSQRPTNPYQLISTAATVVVLLGSAGAYVASNLASAITSTSIALKEETVGRKSDEERIYDLVGRNAEKAWSKDAHAEFERRIDDRNAMEQEYAHETFAKLERDLVPREENDQRWKDQTEDVARLERQLTASLDRLAEHVNKSDDTNAQKFSDVDKGLHGYGISDEVKDLQGQVRDVADKIFRLIAPDSGPSTKKPSGD